MTRAERAGKVQQVLDALYPEVAIPLRHRDPFTLLVAVLLSAQTTDKKVNQVTPELFARADTPEAMAALEVHEIRSIIRPIGLAPQKAANLRALGRMLVDEFGAQVPRQMEQLERLPGVGHKTASVVMVQAFGQPAFPVDTHIHRLARRWRLSDGTSVARTERDLKKVFARDSWGKVHLQIIYFGREYCPARFHDLGTCPICSWAASKKQIESEKRGARRRFDGCTARKRGNGSI